MHLFIINSKNYFEAAGEKALRLAGVIDSITKEEKNSKAVKIVLAVPAFSVGQLSSEFRSIDYFCQHLDDHELGSTTGFLIPEIAKSFGASGSLINHSEHRIPSTSISHLVGRLRELALVSVVCARDGEEVSQFAEFEPDYIAIEPPELIGSGRAVSKTRPELIVDSRKQLDAVVDRLKSKTKLLCGAGIIDPIDATKAIELGSEGILVASGIIKSQDWRASIQGLTNGLIAAKERRRV